MTIDKFGRRRRYYPELPKTVLDSKAADNYYSVILTITGVSGVHPNFLIFNSGFIYFFPLQIGSVTHISIVPKHKVEIIVNGVNYKKNSILGLVLKYKDKMEFAIPRRGRKNLYVQFVIKCPIQKNY